MGGLPGSPRASGGGPQAGRSAWLLAEFSPRERGWSATCVSAHPIQVANADANGTVTDLSGPVWVIADVVVAAIRGAYVPPPPGSDRDALPPELRRLIAPQMRPYLSTACETADVCRRAAEVHPDRGDELRDWAAREHGDCRITRKQDMAGCGCDCHGEAIP
ncbi:hypothetical protein [Streptomyces sp. NBC_01190]|uniref:hypothetical protein n=1 Tax=Streptomyces sp. NBC_01190 TaxID=2903767 RepID=UPI003867C0F6|nr:hypothetical protein OG519_29070 [Streptomyces sp. NBC_01190]